MDFIKKHYEKLILLLLLVIFIASMFHVLNIIKQTGEITDEHLQIPTRDPDYKIHDAKDPAFSVAELMKQGRPDWKPATVRIAANEEHYSDLVQGFPIVRCPFCEKLIPRSYMEKEQVCPHCKNANNGGKPFVVPEDIPEITIPPELLREMGLDANDRNAPYYDIDGDGFSNIYEYYRGTEMNNPQSRPPLWQRLRIVNVGKIPLPIRFTNLQTNDKEDPRQWEIMINIGNYTDPYMIGSSLVIEERFFQITKVERKVAEDGKTDASVVTLKEMDGGNNELTMTINAPVNSFSDKAILVDSATNKQFTLSQGDSLSLGNYLTGTESYRIKELDPTGKTVLLENPNVYEGDTTLDKNKVIMRVTRAGQIPFQMRIREQKTRQDNLDGGYPPGPQFQQVRPPRRRTN